MSKEPSLGQRLAQESGAVLAQFKIPEPNHGPGSYAILYFPDGNVRSVGIPAFSAVGLRALAGDWDEAYRTYLQVQTNGRLATAHRDEDRTVMLRILRNIYADLLAPVHNALRAGGVAKDTNLVLLPEKELAKLPLHACCWAEGDGIRYLLDEYTISYTPQFEFFATSLMMERQARRDKLLAVGNPRKDLQFSQLEFEVVHRALGEANCALLLGEQASRSNVISLMAERHWFHFACHSEFNLSRPAESRLYLAGQDFLYVVDIMNREPLTEAYLVVLSGCESGLYGAHDQVGFPTAFLRVGVPTVYATLWAVHDFLTLFLVRRTYEVLHDSSFKGGKPAAIRTAQRWLRDLSVSGAIQWLIDWQRIATPQQGQVLSFFDSFLSKLLQLYGPNYRYFDHPRVWAAFQCLGA